MKQLHPYQSKGIDDIALLFGQGIMSIIFQLSTGGGKTVTFAGLINRFLSSPAFAHKKIVIAVHRDELLTQARQTIYEWYGIVAQPITAGVNWCDPSAQVYITMVETAHNRLKRNPKFFGDVGLFLIDEAHFGAFTKLHAFFPNVLTIGFTATPISASKKHPLKDQYKEIVCCIDTPDLIKMGVLVGDITYGSKDLVDLSKVKLNSKGDYDEGAMAKEYKASRHVHNCVDNYRKNADGTKAIVFNITIEHNDLVAEAFKLAGYKVETLDSELNGKSKTEQTKLRKAKLKWFHDTPGAILCNVGILTAGFDEKSVETVIVNRATTSLPLWLQMTGRGGRSLAGKTHFNIIDLGNNVKRHGYWSDERDWRDIFFNPDKPKKKKDGVAPVKNCCNEECDCMIPVQCKVCPICGTQQDTSATEYDAAQVECELLKANVDVTTAIRIQQSSGYRPHFALHIIKDEILNEAQDKKMTVTNAAAYALLNLYQDKVAEWTTANKSNYDQFLKEVTAKWFFDGLKKRFNWEPAKLSLSL